MPCAPSFAFGLGEHSATAKVLYIRGMLARVCLLSSQLSVMRLHSAVLVDSMLAALDETLHDIARCHSDGRLAELAGPMPAGTGFARLV